MRIIGLIMRWGLGMLLCMAAMGGLLQGDIKNALIVLIIGLLLLPPVWNLFFKKKEPVVKGADQYWPDPPVSSKPGTSRVVVKELPKDHPIFPAKPTLRPVFMLSDPIKEPEDDSIIDVTGQSYQIPTDHSTKQNNVGIPYWAHHYVYSYEEIKHATKVQQQFYQTFKEAFLKGVYIDLEGNNNYAFILLFDLLREYESQRRKDIVKLENQLRLVGAHYPKTKPYCNSNLIQRMSLLGDTDGIARIRAESSYGSDTYYNTNEWQLGTKYKKILQLKNEDVEVLNKLWNPNNNFCGIEPCFLEILKLYLAVRSGLASKYLEQQLTIKQAFDSIADWVVRKEFHYRAGSDNYKYATESCIRDINVHILRLCENAVREVYGHKRKIGTDISYTSAAAQLEFETRVSLPVTELLPSLVSTISQPNDLTEIELNQQNTTRWKLKFDELVTSCIKNPEVFVTEIIRLGALNIKNPSIEHIFFDASKAIAATHKESALKLYIYYVDADLKSATFDNKQLTKTIQKSLFKTSEQLQEFERLITDFIKHKDLEKALNGVKGIYAVSRKKIKLDRSSIVEVEQLHSGTVRLLNEYLKDDGEAEELPGNSPGSASDEVITLSIDTNEDVKEASIYSNATRLTEIQREALGLFAKSSFSMSQVDFEQFAKGKNVFKNPLIESINEACYELIDDVLIEEEDDLYTINEYYYQKLLA